MVSHVVSLLAAFPFKCNTGREHSRAELNELVTRRRRMFRVMMDQYRMNRSHVRLSGWRLTKVVDLDGGNFADVPLDEKINVGQDDERRSQRRPGVVLHDQVVALELPVDVAVGLHLREGVAAERRRRVQTSHMLV